MPSRTTNRHRLNSVQQTWDPVAYQGRISGVLPLHTTVGSEHRTRAKPCEVSVQTPLPIGTAGQRARPSFLPGGPGSLPWCQYRRLSPRIARHFLIPTWTQDSQHVPWWQRCPSTTSTAPGRCWWKLAGS